MRAWFITCGLAIICSTGCRHSGSTGNPTAPTPAPTPAVPASITVTGTVVEIGGGPVAGARIQIRDGAEETVTDESGRFSLTVIAPLSNRSLGATISKIGYDSANTTLVGGSIKIELQRQRRVTGRVVDTEGTPVPFLDLTGYEGGAKAQTDANGSFEIVAGHYFWLRKNGFVERFVTLPPGQDVSIGDVRIQRAITITDPAHLRVDLSANDLEEQFFDDSDQNQSCYPCLWIDVKSGRPLQVDIHASEAVHFVVSVGDYYSTLTRSVIGPGGLDMRVQIPAGQEIILLGLATTPGVQVPLDHPVTFDLDVTAP
jgi:hypothetical protein